MLRKVNRPSCFEVTELLYTLDIIFYAVCELEDVRPACKTGFHVGKHFVPTVFIQFVAEYHQHLFCLVQRVNETFDTLRGIFALAGHSGTSVKNIKRLSRKNTTQIYDMTARFSTFSPHNIK